MPIGAAERARVPAHHHPAEGSKARGVGLRHSQRIGDAHGAWPVHGMTKDRRKARLELARPVHVERAVGNVELLRERKFALERLERTLATVKLEPAFLAQITGGAGLGQQRLMLGERMREQRPHQPRGLNQALGARSGTKRDEPRRKLRQKAQVIVGFRRALERHAQERDRVGRKGGRKDGVAFDHPGIAVGGLFADRTAIDERNRKAAFGEVQRDRGANNAGTEHDSVEARHAVYLPNIRRPRGKRAASPILCLTDHMGMRPPAAAPHARVAAARPPC